MTPSMRPVVSTPTSITPIRTFPTTSFGATFATMLAMSTPRDRARRMTEIVPFVDEGLGHSSYLIDLGDGRALVVDPPRIPNRHVDEAHARGLAIALTADTHSHADYVS